MKELFKRKGSVIGSSSVVTDARQKNIQFIQTLCSLDDKRAYMPKATTVSIVDKNHTSTEGISINVSVEKQPVRCVTVPSGFFMARRNGCVFITGNCPRRSDEFDIRKGFIARP